MSSFTAIATDPVQRMIEVHAQSLRDARKNDQCANATASSGASDAMQCRIVVNALRREIDRLMRGTDHDACCSSRMAAGIYSMNKQGDVTSSGGTPQATFAQLAMPSAARRSYAVAPLGPSLAMSLNHSSESSAPRAAIHALNHRAAKPDAVISILA